MHSFALQKKKFTSSSPLSTGPPRDHGALHRHRHASATTLRLISLSPRGILQWPEEQSRSGCDQDGGNADRTNPSMTGSSRARPGDRPCIPYVGRTDGGVPAGAGARPGPGPAAGYESPCVSLFYVNDIGSTGSRGRTRGIPCVYPSP